MSQLSCPLPLSDYPKVLLAHGGGGRLMQELLGKLVLPSLSATPPADTDAAVLQVGSQRLAFTTDSYVVNPLRFPGGDIGRLAVCGTVNDLAMVGARPLFLSLALIIEEGFALADLQSVLASIRATAESAGVSIVTGDTKVVDHGKGDGIFINTAGIGLLDEGPAIAPSALREGDAIIVSGDLGRHGIAVMAAREGIDFETAIESDVACLHHAVAALLAAGIRPHCMRDLTRGGLVSALSEIAASAGLAMQLEESAICVSPAVAAACELLGLDPLYVANEGRFAIVLPAPQAEAALAVLHTLPVSAKATRIGEVTAGKGLALRTRIGVWRPLDVLSGEQLPRIC